MNTNFKNIIELDCPIGTKQHEIQKTISMLMEAGDSASDALSVVDNYFETSLKERFLYWVSGNSKIYAQMILIRENLCKFITDTTSSYIFPYEVLMPHNNTDWCLCCAFWLKALRSHLEGNSVDSPKDGEYLTTKKGIRIKAAYTHPLIDTLESQMVLVTAHNGRQYPYGATVELEVFWDEFFTEKMKR